MYTSIKEVLDTIAKKKNEQKINNVMYIVILYIQQCEQQYILVENNWINMYNNKKKKFCIS